MEVPRRSARTTKGQLGHRYRDFVTETSEGIKVNEYAKPDDMSRKRVLSEPSLLTSSLTTVKPQDNREGASNYGSVKSMPTVDNVHRWVENARMSSPERAGSQRFGHECLSPIEQAVITLTNIMANQNVMSASNTDKFAIRQSIGKELPKFDGDPRQWLSYKTAYDETTKMCSYSEQENLMRLDRSLIGEARKIVSGMLISPKNVQKIIRTLQIHFGNPDRILGKLVNDIETCPVIRDDQPETIIQLATAINNLTNSLVALGQPESLEGGVFMAQLNAKLSTAKRVEWLKWLKKSERKSNLASMAQWLEEEVEYARACTDAKEQMYKNDHRINKRQRQVFFAEEKTSNTKPRNKAGKMCVICKKHGHTVASCQSFEQMTSSDRWKLVREKRLCVCCLKENHMAKNCFTRRKCKFESCEKNHHPSLHTEGAVIAHVQGQFDDKNANLMIVPIRIKGTKGCLISTYAMLDNGSTTTLISQDLLYELGIQGRRSTIYVKTLHPEPIQEECQIINLTIRPKTGQEEIKLNGVRSVKNLHLPNQSATRDRIDKWEHLRNIVDIPIYDKVIPKMLIGMDNADLQAPTELVKGPEGSPTAVKTKLGWIVYEKDSSGPKQYNFFTSEEEALAILDHEVKEQFSIDSLGVKVGAVKTRSIDDERAQRILNKTTSRIGNKWETGLIWRYDEFAFPESYTQAFKRLRVLERKMDKDDEFASQIVTKIDEYLEKEYARKLTPEEVTPSHKEYYLPYFGVTNPHKPKKTRLVFDAASKSHGVSFNDMILPGPDKLTPLLSVIMKFRQRPIAVMGDLRDMFHRVQIRKEDLLAQRFLYRGMNREMTPDVYEIGVMMFGSACSPCAAQEVKNRNAIEFREQFPEAVKAIISKHYVDDYLDSFDTTKEAQKMIREVSFIHEKGNFVICNWTSNSKEVLDVIPKEFHAKRKPATDMDIDKMLITERVLGLHWAPKEDFFTFASKFDRIPPDVLTRKRMPTKREALSVIMSVYDPLGFLSNFIVTAKIVLQHAWKTQIGWDDELPMSCQAAWRSWVEDLHRIDEFRIPRCYFHGFMQARVQLHVFVDSSEDAYAAVAYFRIESGSEIHVRLIMAKARVTPIKYVSIPRLELQAAVLGTRLSKTIAGQHEKTIERTAYWTDSKTVISWLKSESRRLTPFVAHRVGEIQEETNISHWKWIPTALNVADEATRCSYNMDWTKGNRWVNGPDFLRLREDEWPNETFQQTDDVNQQVRAEARRDFVLLTVRDSFMNIDRFSNYNRAIRTTSYVQRFIYNCQHKDNKKLSISPNDLREAEKIWWRIVQSESYEAEIHALRNKKPLPRQGSLAKQSVFIDQDGVLRLDGRLQNAPDLTWETKDPVILPRQHNFTKLLVMEQHRRCLHQGHEQIANELRKRYFIPSLRRLVRTTSQCCQVCQNKRASQMGPLPRHRLEARQRPFTNCGVDYFGPIQVTIGRRHEKRYGCLFTCMTTRAIHLELAGNLTTDSLLMCLIRFVSLRGCPKVLYSDNGTNFVGAERELARLLREFDQQRITNQCTRDGIEWRFTCPRASHQGGIWERMVRSVKKALKTSLTDKYPREETLRTTFREVQRLVNGHPLTYLSSEDGGQALTPNHFLWGTSDGSQPIWGDFDEKDLSLRKQWRIAVRMSEHFWARWLKEYLPTLVRRSKWTKNTLPIKVGDVGVLADEIVAREDWPIGRVKRVFPGNDGVIRTVLFETATGIYRRPVHKIGLFSLIEDFVPKSGESVAEDGNTDNKLN